MKVYGITNCNTVKTAINWLKVNDVGFEFHDYKKAGVTKEKLNEWSQKVGWESLINKRGTTWRSLADDKKQSIINEQAAMELMIEKPSVIKRPIIETPTKIIIGFDETEYQTFKNKR